MGRETIVSEQLSSPSYVSAGKELKEGRAKESGGCSLRREGDR